ncbi:MAG: hypothetical protein WAW91_02615 [Candidatus Nanoperiomorbaceae bacterium]
MDKKIYQHRDLVKREIARLNQLPKGSTEREHDRQRLAAYHDAMTRNFQHERQIHLYITLFFAMLFIGSLAISGALFAQFSGLATAEASAYWPMLLASFTLSLILAVLEAFYIAYYYRVENRTAELYPIATEIYHL